MAFQIPDNEALLQTSNPSDISVSWRDVVKTYPNGHVALRGVSLDAKRGQILALLGTSGSGKTTLLKLVNRLIDPTSGIVSVNGKSTADWDRIELRRSIGYVIQEAGLLPHFTILANVALVPKLQGVKRSVRESRAHDLLELVGLEPARFARLYPRELSGGQRQRVGVARALASDPDLILMDEPFGALDPITRRGLQDEFRALQQRLGKTVILVTHDVREASSIADQVALVDRGVVVQAGLPADLIERPLNDFVRSFFQDVALSIAERSS